MILKEISFGLWRLSWNTIALPKRQLQKWVLTWLPKPLCFLLEDRKHPTVNAQFHQTLSPFHVRCSPHVQAYFPTPTQASHPPGDKVTGCSFWCCLFTNQSTHTLWKTVIVSTHHFFLLRKWLQLWGFNFGLFELEFWTWKATPD